MREWIFEIGIPIAAIVLAGFVARIVLGRIVAALARRNQIPDEQRHKLSQVANWATFMLVIVAVGVTLGVNFGAIWVTFATFAAASLVAFFAVWSLLSNVLASVLILLTRPFTIGDEVRLVADGVSGSVWEINLFYTVLVEEDGSRIVIPSSLMWSKVLTVRRKEQA